MNRGFLRLSFLAWPTSRLFRSIYQNVPKKELDNEDLGVRGTIPAASVSPIFAVSRP